MISRKGDFMSVEPSSVTVSIVVLKHWGINFAVALLASLVRWQLLSKEDRKWYDILTFMLYAFFMIVMVNYFVEPLSWEESTKRGLAMAMALFANEIIRGVLGVLVAIMPVLEKRAKDFVKRGKL